MDRAAPSQDDTRDAAILRAAFTAFARYGLRRTSMADIAAGAGMSRPALYLHYSGKEDIFRALVCQHFAQAEAEADRVLAADAPVEATLLAFLHALDGTAAEAMLTSPHADEILSAQQPFNQAEVREAEARLAARLARWIAEGVALGRLGLSGLAATPEDVAATILAAKSGLKSSATSFAAYRRAEEHLAALFARALAP